MKKTAKLYFTAVLAAGTIQAATMSTTQTTDNSILGTCNNVLIGNDAHGEAIKVFSIADTFFFCKLETPECAAVQAGKKLLITHTSDGYISSITEKE